MPTTETYLLYILLGAVAGMIYSLKRILVLERKIAQMETNILTALGRRKPSAKKKVARKVTKKKKRKR
tara:strand:- start:975 stop:1178 length:204 start_codon:yes stop_codon:yes gene_type:complete